MKKLFAFTLGMFLMTPALMAACTDEEMEKAVYIKEQEARSLAHDAQIQALMSQKAEIDSNVDDLKNDKKTLEEVMGVRVDA